MSPEKEGPGWGECYSHLQPAAFHGIRAAQSVDEQTETTEHECSVWLTHPDQHRREHAPGSGCKLACQVNSEWLHALSLFKVLLWVQSATGVYLTALPAPGGIQIAGKTPSDLSNEHHILTIQKRINDTIAKNKEIYQINPPVRQHNTTQVGSTVTSLQGCCRSFFPFVPDTYCKW